MRRAVLACAALAVSAVARAEPSALLPAGAYRLDMRLASSAELPVLGTSRSTSVSVSLAQVVVADGVLVQSHRVCTADVEGGLPGVRLVMPPAFIAALGIRTYGVDLGHDGRYRADLGVQEVGFRSDGDGRLPTSESDPGVLDTDGDGLPGATLQLVLPALPDGRLQVVQRGQSILDGRVVAPGLVEGRIAVPIFEQAVIAAVPPFLRRQPDIRPEPEGSRFTLRRVPAARSCADLVGEAGHPRS